jgi:hypothetical protein
MLNTGLHGHLNPLVIALASALVPLLAPVVKVLSTPRRAARVFSRIWSIPLGGPASVTTRQAIRWPAPRLCGIPDSKIASSQKRGRFFGGRKQAIKAGHSR